MSQNLFPEGEFIPTSSSIDSRRRIFERPSAPDLKSREYDSSPSDREERL
jgi:hypothetical protein